MTIIVGINLQPGNTIDTRWRSDPIRSCDSVLQAACDETHIDERTVAMNNAPRVLSTGIRAGMEVESKSQRTRVDSNKSGGKAGDWSSRLPNSQRS